jgi:hypothetical protein
MGGGARYAKPPKTILSESLITNFNPPVCFNGPILPNPHNSVKRYTPKKGRFSPFS